MLKVIDEHNVLYKYGLEKYWKDVEERILEDFPNCDLDITVSTKETSNFTYDITIEYNGIFKIKQKEDDTTLEYTHISNDGSVTRSTTLEISTRKTKKTYHNNLYVVLLILKSVFVPEGSIYSEYDDIDIEQIRKYFVCEYTRETYKDKVIEVFPEIELDMESALRYDLYKHYIPFSADDLYTLTNIEYEPFVRNDPLREELVKKAVSMVVDYIFNSADAAGLTFDYMDSYEVYVSDEKNRLIIKFDIGDENIKTISFEAEYYLNQTSHIVNPKKAIAYLLLNFYLWYTVVINKKTTIDDEDYSIFKDAIMSNIDVNI